MDSNGPVGIEEKGRGFDSRMTRRARTGETVRGFGHCSLLEPAEFRCIAAQWREPDYVREVIIDTPQIAKMAGRLASANRKAASLHRHA